MKFKLRYTGIPACITFGPFFMTGMSFDSWEFGIRLGGAIMVTAGLGFMMDIIMVQQKEIDMLLAESKTMRDNLRAPHA